MSIDFRQCLYAISDVIINRPPPLRVFDQIYMKLPDMLLQAELISRWFKKKRVVFIGDGDAIALTMVHLVSLKLVPEHVLPEHVTVLDFDERIVNSVNEFASHNSLIGTIHAELYNIADPLPENHWQRHDAFHTNPPWGRRNDGSSVLAFIKRGIEAVRGESLGCIVIGDHPSHAWTHSVQLRAQSLLLDHKFRVAEMLPQFHRYHLDDDPELTSCAMIAQRDGGDVISYASRRLDKASLHNFYGSENPLHIKYVRDRRNGGKLESNDIQVIPYNEDKTNGQAESSEQIPVHESR
jgi:predicted methyltransferase